MADERNKAIVNDNEDRNTGSHPQWLNTDDSEPGFSQSAEFELGFSLGQWGQRHHGISVLDDAVESSHSASTHIPSSDTVAWPRPLSGQNLLMTMPMDVDGADAMGVESADRGQDSQSKRPKVLGISKDRQHASTSYLCLEAPFASEDHGIMNLLSVPESGLTPSASLLSTEVLDVCKGEESMGTDSPGDGNLTVRMDLSEDLLHLIFSFLGQKDLCRAGATCKLWLAASTHEDFWRSLKFENISISHQNFLTICRRYGAITELNLFGVPSADLIMIDAIRYLRQLRTLTMGKGHLSDTFFQFLIDCFYLTTLVVCDASLGNNIQEITISHDVLRELQILRCRATRISVRCSQLRKLSLRRTSMTYVSLNCPQLHDLDFSSCHKLSDAAIRQAATTCPLLVSLDLSSSSCATDETLRDIASSCPNLSLLDASNCPYIAFETVRLPSLTGLKLLSCEGVTSASMAAISFSRMLETLHLDNCSLLTSISLDLPHLKNISLVHLRKFAELNLRCPALSYIKVSRCSTLRTIRIASKVLQKLVLQKQESLASLSLQCPNVVDVDLSDCESLTNAVCEVFSDGGGCPMLKSLVLDNCDNLSVVELASSSLRMLSLAGCRTMTFLQLSCPNLQSLILDGCDHLKEALFCPVGLESLNLGICPKLNVLHIEALKMCVLELKGCGVLSEASIYCPSLNSLDASFCRQLLDKSLSLTAASCPIIENLILSSCLSIGANGLYSLRCLPRLTLLDLSYTFLTDLQPVYDTCSQLKILKLSACKYLTDSSLSALYRKGALPMLEELDLSYSSIGQTAIAELLSCCKNLVHINLNGCTDLPGLVLGPSDVGLSHNSMDTCMSETITSTPKKSDHLLEILNCTGCPNLKRFVILPTAKYVYLSKVNLNLSTSLKEVDLTCSSLCSLNLSYCSSLEVLKLNCPKLAHLQLLACSVLQDEELLSAISQCKVLEFLNINYCPKLCMLDFGSLRFACPSLKRIHSGVVFV